MIHILVIGDIILDYYHHCHQGAANPECDSGRVYRRESFSIRLGGAGAVASMIADLEQNVHLIGVWPEMSCECVTNVMARKTFWGSGPIGPVAHKHRVVVDGRLHPDRLDDDPDPGAVTKRIAESLRRTIQEVASDSTLIVLADYGKGVLSNEVVRTVLRVARQRSIGILVDPYRGRRWASYGVVTAIKANRREAVLELGLSEEESLHVTTLELATRAYYRLDDPRTVVIVTEGANGMAAVGWEGLLSEWIPAWHADEVDCCGAGDAVMAALAVAWTRGMDLRQSCTLAAAVAAQQVESLGVSPVRLESLPRALLAPDTLDDSSRALA